MEAVEKLTDEVSQEQSKTIRVINASLPWVNVEYLKLVIYELHIQTQNRTVTAKVTPMHIANRSKLLREQAKALSLLVEYKNTLAEIEKIRASIPEYELQHDVLSNTFL